MLRLAAAFNHPLQAIPTDVHPGRLSPASGAIVKVSPANVVLTGLKKAEDSDAVIFRFIETAGKDAVAHVDLDASMFGQPAEVVEVDLLERPVASPSARKRTGGFDVSVPSNGIASVRLAASTSA
jgi:alpha-mannosidase